MEGFGISVDRMGAVLREHEFLAQALLSAGGHFITPSTVAVDSRTFGVPPSKTKA